MRATEQPSPIAARQLGEVNWTGWQAVHRATLLFVIREGRILLIHKKTGLGKGKINGPGGKVDPGETAVECAIRECQEELCITPRDPSFCGRHLFQFIDGYSIDVSVFRSSDYEGTPTSTREADPLWCELDAIPYERMWADDALWLPVMLRDDSFMGRYLFDEDAMLDHELIVNPTREQLHLAGDPLR